VDGATWHELERDGMPLWCRDHGGAGPAAMFLHGLAGYAREWDETASWLSASCRVLAPGQRGHGRSERRPRDVSRSAFVADAAAWLRQFRLALQSSSVNHWAGTQRFYSPPGIPASCAGSSSPRPVARLLARPLHGAGRHTGVLSAATPSGPACGWTGWSSGRRPVAGV
jgi:hypothetical protein